MTCTCGGFIRRTFLTACVTRPVPRGKLGRPLDRALARGSLDCGCLVILLVDVPSRDGAFFVLKGRYRETAVVLPPASTFIGCGFHLYYLAIRVLLYARHWAVGSTPADAADP
jgi:hypothetical protein